MNLGDKQEMDWRNGVDVMKGEDVLVLIDLLRRNLATDDAAEKALAH